MLSTIKHNLKSSLRNFRTKFFFTGAAIKDVSTHGQIIQGVNKPKIDLAFEAQEKLLRPLNLEQMVIFDIRGFIGSVTATYRSLFPNALVYVFEPFPDNFSALEKRFSPDVMVKPIPKAVSNSVGNREFFINWKPATNSLLPRPKDHRRYYPTAAGSKTTINVDVITIDDFVKNEQVNHIDILKLDIQGGELMALQGAADTLHAGKASLIYLEIMFVPHYQDAPLFHQVWKFLEDHGYSLYNIFSLHVGRNGQIRYGDALFVNNHIRANVIDQFPPEP